MLAGTPPLAAWHHRQNFRFIYATRPSEGVAKYCSTPWEAQPFGKMSYYPRISMVVVATALHAA